MRKLTEFIFFKNTPLVDFQNTIHFQSNAERDNFFLNGNHYSKITWGSEKRFNWVRNMSSIRVRLDYFLLQGINYGTFISDFEPNQRYYFYVIDYHYNNDGTVTIDFMIDPIMTFTQGNVLFNLNNLTVYRRHLLETEYNSKLPSLRNNDDILKTSTKRYTNERSVTFNEFDILIHSTCDLTVDFGDVDNPVINSSEGQTYDKVTSPVDLYVVKQGDFKEFMKALSPYPWISQNLVKIIMIPSELLNDRYDPVQMESTSFTKLNKLRNNGTTLPFMDDALEPLNMDFNALLNMFGLQNDEKHLLRNEYTTTEVYTYDGQQLLIDNGQLHTGTGLEFRSRTIAGYQNEIAIFPRDYRSATQSTAASDTKGSYLNDAIYFRNFDHVPILIDSYNLALANTANQRELAESQLVTNKISNVFDGSADIRDRFFNAVSLVSNFSPMNLFSKFNEEHNFFKQQQAQLADMALQSNNITAQTNNNSLAIANNYFGLHVKHAQPTVGEWNKIKKYYKMFGFSINEEGTGVNPHTQTICDYLQFGGSWKINSVPIPLMEMMRAQFENGVRLWHNNNTQNPMGQNIMNNTFR